MIAATRYSIGSLVNTNMRKALHGMRPASIPVFTASAASAAVVPTPRLQSAVPTPVPLQK